MAIEKRGADTYRIGFQTLNADGTYKWVRETFHATPGLSEAYQRMEAEVALERLKLQAQQPGSCRNAAEHHHRPHVRGTLDGKARPPQLLTGDI